jgi:hypothetical protein
MKMADSKNEIAERNKLHLLCDEVGPIPDDLYGYDKALAAAGVKVLDSENFGSYQGEWWAQVQFPNGEVFYATGSYGSCSGCDAFEGEFGWGDDDKPDYLHRLKDFGRGYLDNCFTLEAALKEASRNIEWDSDAAEMLTWLQGKAEGRS